VDIVNVRLLVVEGCPGAAASAELLGRVLADEGLAPEFETVVIEDAAAAERERFIGSPSITLDGLDIEEARRADQSAFTCRMYSEGNTQSGVPPEAMVRDAVRRALATKTRVLFLCTGNSCRSQMAEGWARALKGDVLEAHSAGVETHGLNPRAVAVMTEAGVDISQQRSKHVDELKDVEFDFVVTVCDRAHESCPLFPGRTRVVHVGFDDPPRLAEGAASEEEALAQYRRVRDEIRAFVETLPEALGSGG
jgi:arsenate reductase